MIRAERKGGMIDMELDGDLHTLLLEMAAVMDRLSEITHATGGKLQISQPIAALIETKTTEKAK